MIFGVDFEYYALAVFWMMKSCKGFLKIFLENKEQYIKYCLMLQNPEIAGSYCIFWTLWHYVIQDNTTSEPLITTLLLLNTDFSLHLRI